MKLLKVVLYSIFTLGLSCDLSAQITALPPFPRNISKMVVVDSGKIRVWYALNAVDIKNPDTFDDWQCLEIGSHASKYYSYFIYRSDSLCTERGNKNKDTQSAPIRCGKGGKQDGKWSEYYYSDFFKDFSSGIITEYTYMPRNIPHCQYAENISVLDWTMLNDTATIADYLCQKAVCSYRGRNFEAWFATDIPISNGPWKFGGLPGLILKVYDADKLYVFECTKIEIHHHTYPIKMHEVKYLRTDRDKYRKLVKDINEDYFKMAGWVFTDGKRPPNPPYNPLELE